jgi:hypothetical protein
VGDINPRGIFIGIWGFKGLLGAIGGGIGEKGGGVNLGAGPKKWKFRQYSEYN